MTTANFLIVGQGVAGSVLAWTLDQLGCRVVVADAPNLPSASGVAAGIVNPLTGRKLVRTWRADELFPFLHNFYRDVEANQSASFFHPLPIYRPYRSLAEKADYETFTAHPSVAKYVNQAVDNQYYESVINNPFGGLEVAQSGWLNVNGFIDSIRTYFQKKNQFIPAEVVVKTLIINKNNVEWNGVSFQKILFCDGTYVRENSLFDWLPYNVVKGQILTARVAHYPIKNIVNQGVFILPVNDSTIRIGATYSWHDVDWETTTDGRAFLEAKVRAVLKIPYEIIGQSAGIRPATKDRRPFIGIHPVYSSVGIFGGFGSKGVSLSPYLAHQFAGHLLEGKDLDAEVNIQRCLSL